MKLLVYIIKGKAVFADGALRCAAARPKDNSRVCNKMIAKANMDGQIAGNFLCDRCKQIIEVRLAPARSDINIS